MWPKNEAHGIYEGSALLATGFPQHDGGITRAVLWPFFSETSSYLSCSGALLVFVTYAVYS